MNKKEYVRDREDALMRAIKIYDELGQNEKAQKPEKEMKILKEQSSITIKSAEIGRNAPCLAATVKMQEILW